MILSISLSIFLGFHGKASSTTGIGPIAVPGSTPPKAESDAPHDFEGSSITITHQCLSCHQKEHPIEMERYLWGTHYKERIKCIVCHGTKGHNEYIVMGFKFKLSTLGADGQTRIGSGKERQYLEWWPRMLVQAYQACQNCHSSHYWEWVGVDRKPDSLTNANTPFHGYLRYDHGISSWWDTQMSSFGLAERDHWGDEMFGQGCILCHSQTMEWNIAGVDPDHLKPIQEVFPDLVQKQQASFQKQASPTSTTPLSSLYLARCVECHARHMFSKEEAQRPEACAKCHMGPDHPQYEAYTTSKHGWAYQLYGGYPSGRAPTCTTCHMSEKASDGHTIHTTNRGIAWNYKKGTPEFDKARKIMLGRCQLCHSKARVASILDQVDEASRNKLHPPLPPLYLPSIWPVVWSVMRAICSPKKRPKDRRPAPNVIWDPIIRNMRPTRPANMAGPISFMAVTHQDGPRPAPPAT